MGAKIRLANIDDAGGILAIYAPYCETTSVTFEIAVPTREQISERIVNVSNAYPWLVAETEHGIAGYVYATRFRERAGYRWTTEVAVYIDASEQRRGLGRALYTSLFSILRAQGYSKAIAGITMPNPASVRLHEGLGFVRTGTFYGVGHKDGKWLDVGWWQLELQPETKNPAEPKPFSALRESPGVAAALEEGIRLIKR
jgi:L-amino acid N-acyltransferase YncA